MCDPIKKQIQARTYASKVWKAIVINILLKDPNSFFMALIAPKHGALNKLKTTNAYADAGEKKLKAEEALKRLYELDVFDKRLFITFMEDTTCSLAIIPCMAQTVASQLFVPRIG